jgi:hypothetical protein
VSGGLLSVSFCTFQFPGVNLNITHFGAHHMTLQAEQLIDIPGILNSLSVSFHGPHCTDTPLHHGRLLLTQDTSPCDRLRGMIKGRQSQQSFRKNR